MVPRPPGPWALAINPKATADVDVELALLFSSAALLLLYCCSTAALLPSLPKAPKRARLPRRPHHPSHPIPSHPSHFVPFKSPVQLACTHHQRPFRIHLNLVVLPGHDSGFLPSTVVTALPREPGSSQQPPQQARPDPASTLQSAFLDLCSGPICDCPHVLAKHNPDSLLIVLTTKHLLH